MTLIGLPVFVLDRIQSAVRQRPEYTSLHGSDGQVALFLLLGVVAFAAQVLAIGTLGVCAYRYSKRRPILPPRSEIFRLVGVIALILLYGLLDFASERYQGGQVW